MRQIEQYPVMMQLVLLYLLSLPAKHQTMASVSQLLEWPFFPTGFPYQYGFVAGGSCLQGLGLGLLEAGKVY